MNQISNPFETLKLRTLVFLLLLALPTLILTQILFKRIIGFGDALVESITLTLWLYGIVMVWMWYQFKRKEISWKKLIGGFPDNFSWGYNLALLVCVLIFNFGSILASVGILSYIFPDFILHFLNDKPNTHSLFPEAFLIVDTLTTVAIAPFVEELLMRGVFLHRFYSKWGINKALFIAGLIFAIGHANIIGMFMVALVLSILYLKYKSLLVPMFFHAMNNITVSLLQLSAGKPEPNVRATIQDAQSTLWLGLLLVVISSPLLIRFLIKNWPKKENLIMPYQANNL